MPAGGPGDHWLSDLQDWDLRPFGDPIDGLVLDILGLGGQRQLDRPKIKTALWNAYLAGPYAEPAGKLDRGQLAEELIKIRDARERYARDSGWEIPDRR